MTSAPHFTSSVAPGSVRQKATSGSSPFFAFFGADFFAAGFAFFVVFTPRDYRKPRRPPARRAGAQPTRARRRIASPPQTTVTPASVAAATAGGTKVNFSTPARPRASWSRWKVGQTTTQRSSDFGSGMKRPESQIIGRKRRFPHAGADEPETSEPSSSPIALNGIVPATSTIQTIAN